MALSENGKKVVEGIQGLFRDLETLGVTGVTKVQDKVDEKLDGNPITDVDREFSYYLGDRSRGLEIAEDRFIESVARILGRSGDLTALQDNEMRL